MIDRWRPFRYVAAVAAVGAALALKLLLVPLVTQDAPFLLFFIAVMLAAWIGGLGPGLLATVLAAVLNNYFFIQPYGRFTLDSPDQIFRLALFVIEGLFISLICARLQAARHHAEQCPRGARDLEKRMLEIGDAEQRRIGHDLHDGLGQHLTGIALLARRLEQRLAAEDSPRLEEAAKISALARGAVEWTHDLCRSLSPPALETRGLAEALRELASNAETLFNIQCRFVQHDEFVFRDVRAGVHLYRIAQEAISNAVKHGHATQVQLSLSSEPCQSSCRSSMTAGNSKRCLRRQPSRNGVADHALPSRNDRRFARRGASPGSLRNRCHVPLPTVAQQFCHGERMICSPEAPQPATKSKVLVVEDHAVVRQGLAMLIDDEADLTVAAAPNRPSRRSSSLRSSNRTS